MRGTVDYMLALSYGIMLCTNGFSMHDSEAREIGFILVFSVCVREKNFMLECITWR
jgi:hypothetical protein